MAHADLDSSGRVVVHTVWNEKELITQVPGSRWDALAKVWVIPSAWAALVTLRGVFREQLTLSERLIEWVWGLRNAWVDRSLELRTALEPVDDGSQVSEVLRSWRM